MDAIEKLYLDPMVWIYSPYATQRELYASLLRHLEPSGGGGYAPLQGARLRRLCGMRRVLDMVRQFYWEKPQGPHAVGTKPLVHPKTRHIIGSRPSPAEVAKLRLLVLCLADAVTGQDTPQGLRLVLFLANSATGQDAATGQGNPQGLRLVLCLPNSATGQDAVTG